MFSELRKWSDYPIVIHLFRDRILFQGIYYTFGLYFTTFGSLVSHLFRRRLYNNGFMISFCKTNKAEKPGLEHYFHRHQVDKLLPLIICWPFGAIMGAIIGHEPVFSLNFVRHLIRAPLKTSLRSWSRRSCTNEFPLYYHILSSPRLGQKWDGNVHSTCINWFCFQNSLTYSFMCNLPLSALLLDF